MMAPGSAPTRLSGGFQDAPIGAAHAFRAAMTVMARPGDIRDLSGVEPPPPLSVAAGTLILTLCDADTGVYLAGAVDCSAVRDWMVFQAGARLVPAADADFAIGRWADLMPLDQFRVGTPEHPDRSATLIVEMDQLDASGAVLRGPGIRDEAQMSLPDAAVMAENAAQFPLGVDFFLTCGARVGALPRSTRITMGEAE